jgi:hypothetical protein
MATKKMSEKDWEGSAKDKAQDKKLAKKHGMSFNDWEKSKMDVKHDKQQSMKGLKSGGVAKMHKGGKTNEDMKSMGRGMAKVADQKSGTKG